MIFRQATMQDLDAVMAVIEDGRRALGSLGIDQWQGKSPNRAGISQNIELGQTRVAADEKSGEVLGTLAYVVAGEPDYANVVDGAWLLDLDHGTPCEYVCLHRVAVSASARRRGVASFMIREAIEAARAQGARSLRVDTHPGNLPMQSALAGLGLTHCCDVSITLPDELTPLRLGFEVLL